MSSKEDHYGLLPSTQLTTQLRNLWKDHVSKSDFEFNIHHILANPDWRISVEDFATASLLHKYKLHSGISSATIKAYAAPGPLSVSQRLIEDMREKPKSRKRSRA